MLVITGGDERLETPHSSFSYILSASGSVKNLLIATDLPLYLGEIKHTLSQ